MDTRAAALSAAPLGTTTGAAAFNPLRQYSKMTPRAHALTSKKSYRSLTSAECKALQFPPRKGKLAGNWLHNGHVFTGYQTL